MRRACLRPLAAGETAKVALNGGYHAAFLAGALFAVAGGLIGTLLRRAPAGAQEGEEAVGVPAAAEAE